MASNVDHLALGENHILLGTSLNLIQSMNYIYAIVGLQQGL